MDICWFRCVVPKGTPKDLLKLAERIIVEARSGWFHNVSHVFTDLGDSFDRSGNFRQHPVPDPAFDGNGDFQPVRGCIHFLAVGPRWPNDHEGIANGRHANGIKHGGRIPHRSADNQLLGNTEYRFPVVGPRGDRPREGFNPTSPQQAAGTRIDPPPSLACASGRMPAATAAAAPPLEPPVVRSGRQGLRVVPVRMDSAVKVNPNSGVVVGPKIFTPACLNR